MLKVNFNGGKRKSFNPDQCEDVTFQGGCGDTGSQGSVIGFKQAKSY